MMIHGLTGGIGSGKSTVAAMIRTLGIPVLDADQFARAVVEPGTTGLAEIVACFGPEVLNPDGGLARDRLGAIVFAAPEKRRQLEEIVHPRVRQAMAEAVQRHAGEGAPLAFMDIPLLFESRNPKDFASVTVVHVPVEIQLQRVMARDGLSEDAVRARLGAQLPIDEKARRATWVIDNSGSEDATRAQVELLIQRLRAEAGGGDTREA